MYGVLKVRPLDAFISKDEDAIGKMDPYVKVRVGLQAVQTIPSKGMGKSPTWNEEFVFNLNGEDSIRFTVYDSDIGKDDFLGKAKVMLSQVAALGVLDTNVPLHSKILNRNVGNLHIRIEYAPQKSQGQGMPPQTGTAFMQQPGQGIGQQHQFAPAPGQNVGQQNQFAPAPGQQYPKPY